MQEYALQVTAQPLFSKVTSVSRCPKKEDGVAFFAPDTTRAATKFVAHPLAKQNAITLVEQFVNNFACDGGNVVARPVGDTHFLFVRTRSILPTDIVLFYLEENTLTVHKPDGSVFYLALWVDKNAPCFGPTLVFAPSDSTKFVICSTAVLSPAPPAPQPSTWPYIVLGILLLLSFLLIILYYARSGSSSSVKANQPDLS